MKDNVNHILHRGLVPDTWTMEWADFDSYPIIFGIQNAVILLSGDWKETKARNWLGRNISA